MKRNNSIDILKFFAIFFVVCIHVQPFSNIYIGSFDGNIITNLIVTFARFAVPVFFAVSGYLLSEKIKRTRDSQRVFISYIKNIVKIYFSWLIFYFIFDISIIILKSYIEGLGLATEIQIYLSEYSLWKLFYFGTDTTSYPLWFLLALIWSVFIIFLFYKHNKIIVLLIISLGLNLIGQFGQSYYGLFSLAIDTKDAIFFGLFYTTLGFFLSNQYQYFKKINIKSIQLVSLIILFSVLQVFERYILVDFFGGKSGNYYLSTIPLTFSLLILVLKLPNGINNRFMSNVGENAVGIFVSHNFLISFSYYLVSFIGVAFIIDTVLWQILFVPFVFITSYYFYKIVQMVKRKLIIKRA